MEKMTGGGTINNQIPLERFVDKMTIISTATKMRVIIAIWQLKNIQLILLSFFTCYPFAINYGVIFDFLINKDICLVSSNPLKEKKHRIGAS